MKKQALKKLGLSQNKSKIYYFSFFEPDPVPATKIAHQSGVHRINIYESIAKLKEKSLVPKLTVTHKKQALNKKENILQKLGKIKKP